MDNITNTTTETWDWRKELAGAQPIGLDEELPSPRYDDDDAATGWQGGRATASCAAEGRKPKKRKRTERPKGERFAVLNQFVDETMADLTRPEIAVWLVLYRDTKRDGTARTGQADIARRAGLGRRTVIRAIAKLEARGLLAVVRRGYLGAGPSVYRIRPYPPSGKVP